MSETQIEETPIVEETTRRLATIRKIGSVEDIVFTNKETGEEEVAANIVKVTVDGWSLVTQRSNNFKVGDLVIYFEIDSLFPEGVPAWDFMEKSKWRLRTIKLKGQLSQGLILPISIINEIDDWYVGTNKEAEPEYIGRKGSQEYGPFNFDWYLEEGLDLTEVLGITKYEKPIPANLRGKVKGNFPHFLRKTDEERIQNIPWVLEKFKGQPFYVTEKLDGSSFTCYWKEGAFGVCSRNLDLTETEDNTFWATARKLQLEEKLAGFGKNLALQGEMVGPGIQDNIYKLKEVTIYFFNVFNIDEQRFYDFQEMKNIIGLFGLETVPIVSENFTLNFPDVQTILSYSDGPSKIGQCLREGFVYRPVKEVFVDRLGRLSFKAISNQFLLKHE